MCKSIDPFSIDVNIVLLHKRVYIQVGFLCGMWDIVLHLAFFALLYSGMCYVEAPTVFKTVSHCG